MTIEEISAEIDKKGEKDWHKLRQEALLLLKGMSSAEKSEFMKRGVNWSIYELLCMMDSE